MLSVVDRLDVFVLLSALSSFMFFLVGHVAVIRYFRPSSSLKVLMRVFVAGLIANAAASIWSVVVPVAVVADYPRESVVIGGLASVLIYTILVFTYVITVFNLGATARRIRLLRELYQAPSRALTLDEVYKVYNADVILQLRLSRLVRSGQLHFDGHAYRIGSLFFLFQSRLLWMMRSLLGIPEDRF